MWQRFTERARKVVFYAQEEAGRLGENYVSTEHLLLGLVREEDSVACRMLIKIGLSPAQIRSDIEREVTRGDGKIGQDMQLTPRAKRVIDLAYDEARQSKDNYIGTEHLLLGLVREGEGLAGRVLSDLGVTVEMLRTELATLNEHKPAEKSDDELMSLEEAAQFLGISKPTIYRMLGQGEIQGLKAGRQWRFRKRDLRTFLEKGQASSEPTVSADDIDFIKAALSKAGMRQVYSAIAGAKPIEAVASAIIGQAVEKSASHIHIEPTQTELRVRYRIGRTLEDALQLPKQMQEVLVHKLKSMAAMDTNERAVSQTGRIRFPAALSPHGPQRTYDIQVATILTNQGEAITMQLTDLSQVLVPLDRLDLSPGDLSQVRGWLKRQSGVILSIGPHGSGKTSPLYGMLLEICRPAVRTFVIEEPATFAHENAILIEVGESAGRGWADALRSVLLHDPDVIYVSEVPDAETAQLAITAAANGQLVLTSMEVPGLELLTELWTKHGLSFESSVEALGGTLSTRLARRLCDRCREPLDKPAMHQALDRLQSLSQIGDFLAQNKAVFYRGAGCDCCKGSGYLGKIPFYELITWTPQIREAQLQGLAHPAILEVARQQGTRSLLEDALDKAAQGLTSLSEVLRVAIPQD